MILKKNFPAIFFISLACSVSAQTNEITPATSTIEQSGRVKKTLDNAISTSKNLYHHGRLSVLLSGYAYHGRSTYTPKKISELNEKAWGFGISKELRDEKDNEESINFLILSDSHKNPQLSLAYNYQWMKSLNGDWEAGIGYTAGLVSRTDMIDSIPFPGILPLFSIGTRDTKLLMTYVPTLFGNGNGDVLHFALRIALK